MSGADEVKEGRFLNTLAQVCGALAAVTGFTALLGWVSGYLILSSFGSPVPMAPSTALLFISYGGGVFLRIRNPQSRMVYLSGLYIGLAGVLAALLLFFLSYLGIHLNIEHLGIPISGTANGVPIGHISPLTAFCFVLVGLTFLTALSSTADSSGRAIAAFWLACLIILTSFILFLAYLFGTPILYGGRFIPPAFSTSLAFIALGTSLLTFAGLQTRWKSAKVETADKRTLNILILVFVILAAGIISAGYVYYHSYEKQYRVKVEQELSAIAEMKVDELVNWRGERLKDAAVFFKNDNFSDRVRRYLSAPEDTEAKTKLRTWMYQFQANSQYDSVFLLDPQGVKRMSVPSTPEPVAYHFLKNASEALRSGKVTFLDFHRDGPDQPIHLSILVPVLDSREGSVARGILALNIDPEKYLYPFIIKWPTPSRTAESLIVRREGDEVVFLNELKFQKNTALNLRIPMEKTEILAVKAALGRKGVVEGKDYRGVPAIGNVQAVPDSPWFLVARMDTSEVYMPLRERLWEVVILIGALLICAGAGTGFIWRHQRARYYREKYEAAEALQVSEERFRLLVEGIKDYAIVMLDREGQIVSWNEGAQRIKGYKEEEIIGKNFSCFYPAEDIEKHKPEWELKVAAEEGRFEDESWRLRKDGSRFWANVIITALHDGQGRMVGFSKITRDLTERKQSEERIRKLNRTLAMLSDINQAIVRIREPQALFEQACRIAVEKGNFSLAWIGLLDDSTQRIHPVASAGKSGGYLEKINISLKDEPKGYCPIDSALRKGEHVICNVIGQDEDLAPCQKIALELGFRSSVSFPLKMLDSIRGTVNFYTDEPHFFDEEEIKLLDELAMDISFAMEFSEKETERKRMEEAIQKLNAELEQKVIDRTTQLEAVNKELEAFSYSVSHDLRAPIRHISGFVELLVQNTSQALDEKSGRYLNIIAEATNHMGHLIDDILSFSRMGRAEMQKTLIKSDQLVKDAVTQLQPEMEGRHVVWEIHPLPELYGDPQMLKLVWINLIGNALKYTRKQPHAKIEIGCNDDKDDHIFYIRDNGAGFDMMYVHKLFNIFQRLHRAEEFEGTGVGLANVRRIIQRHGGGTWAEGKVGEGATFFFSLPKANKRAE